MAFTPTTLELLAGSGAGICIWGYVSADTAATIDTAGYFNLSANRLRIGDRIHINADTSGTPAFGLAVVTSNDGTVVDIADMTALGGTDTD